MTEYPWLNKGNTYYKIVLLMQMLLTGIIGFFTDSLVLGISVGAAILIAPLVLMKFQAHAVITRHAAAVATQLFVALHIQQSMGATYMHFEIFAVMAVTSVYRDWKVVVSSVVVVAVHHFLFYYIQTVQARCTFLKNNI